MAEPPRTIAVHTLGCKVNQYDSEALLTLFRERGYRPVDFDRAADVYVINTCSVTREGDRKSRQLVRRARRANPDAVVVVAGCYPQTAPGEAAGIPGVDVILGNRDRRRVVDLVEAVRRARPGAPLGSVENVFRLREFEELPIAAFTGRTRAVVKIQEGCAEFCAYCIIPYARGRPRSRRPEHVRAEVERLAAAGYREVVLAGIHLGAYGRDLAPEPGGGGIGGAGDRPGLAGVLRLIHDVEGIVRIRLSSLEPMDTGDALLETMAALPKVCPHLHLPVQSGADRVLARMRRRYTSAEFRRLAARARALLPDLGLTTDVMAGFPGETEEDHRATLELLEEIGFARLHVFPFSPRAGTPAARFPDPVPAAVRERRVAELIALGERLSLAFHRRLVGREVEVLVEEEAGGDGRLEGYTPNYVRVRFPGGAELRNRLVRVRVTSADAEGVEGTACRGTSAMGEE